VALCAKEIGTAVEAVKATVAKGQQLTLKGFKTLAEAQATFQQARALVARLESRIAEQCDVKRYPQGNTQPASAALSLLAELQIHEDTVHILMCALHSHPPCLSTTEQARSSNARALMTRLESRIAEQRYPQGNAQPASAALSSWLSSRSTRTLSISSCVIFAPLHACQLSPLSSEHFQHVKNESLNLALFMGMLLAITGLSPYDCASGLVPQFLVALLQKADVLCGPDRKFSVAQHSLLAETHWRASRVQQATMPSTQRPSGFPAPQPSSPPSGRSLTVGRAPSHLVTTCLHSLSHSSVR
jgi:hypothetical protein